MQIPQIIQHFYFVKYLFVFEIKFLINIICPHNKQNKIVLILV
jgi:hypothetical protein